MVRNNKAKAVCLTILWIVSFLLFYTFAFIKRTRAYISGSNYSDSFDSLVAYLVSALYFFPMMLQIRKNAQQAGMNQLASWAYRISILYMGALILSPVAFLISLLAS